MAEGTNPATRYQPERIPPKLPLYLLGGFGGILLLTFLALALLYPATLQPPRQGPLDPLPPQPRLETDSTAELRQLRAEEAQRLSSYGWVDQARGIVHIPIEEAMRRLAQQGVPTWPAR